ncbi:MAG: PrgI family protein [Acutalibacteraceae bacterium]|nr:PrgI family protein [Acutalibacteraceae bacterium]
MQNHYVKIPKDMALIKQKFMFGLTKRQIICFGIGLLLGLPAFFIVKPLANDLTIPILAMGIIAMPFIMCGLYNKNGLHLEQSAKLMIEFLKKPKVRTYQSENIFSSIERQIEYNKLHHLISNLDPADRNIKTKKVKK